MAADGLPRWLVYGLVSTALWGCWGVAAKFAGNSGVADYTIQILVPVGLAPVAMLLAAFPGPASPRPGLGGPLFAWLSGVAAGVGNMAFFDALQTQGSAAVVTPLSALFPLVTLALAVGFLRERISRVQCVGAALAVAAVLTFSLDGSGGGGQPAEVGGWLGLALAAVGLWGVAAVFQKLAADRAGERRATVWFFLGFVVVSAGGVAYFRPSWEFPAAGWYWAVGVGLINGLAILTMFAAYATGKAGVVTPLIGLYPLVTVALAPPIFDEAISAGAWVGIGLALAAGLALSFEGGPVTAVPPPEEVRA